MRLEAHRRRVMTYSATEDLDIFRQAVQANLNPVLSRAAGNVLGQRFCQVRSGRGRCALKPNGVHQTAASWMGSRYWGNTPTPAAPIRKYGEPSDFDDLSGEAGFGVPPAAPTPAAPIRTYGEPSDFDDLSGQAGFGVPGAGVPTPPPAVTPTGPATTQTVLGRRSGIRGSPTSDRTTTISAALAPSLRVSALVAHREDRRRLRRYYDETPRL